MGYIICIDPGVQGTGVCISGTGLMPIETAVFKAKSVKDSWIDRETDIVNQLDDFVEARLKKITKAYIELPTFFTSAKGASCATGKNGDDSDLVKLSLLVGRFYEVFNMNEIPVELIKVNDWKGTLTKDAVIQRICRRLKCSIDTFPNHAADAVGMSLHVKGVFAANTGV